VNTNQLFCFIYEALSFGAPAETIFSAENISDYKNSKKIVKVGNGPYLFSKGGFKYLLVFKLVVLISPLGFVKLLKVIQEETQSLNHLIFSQLIDNIQVPPCWFFYLPYNKLDMRNDHVIQ
jgi:hypothetical protein